MSRINKKGRNTGDSRHVRVYHWLMQTVAWRSLNATARAIYIEIAARYRGPGSNNGCIPYSVREAAESLSIGKTTASRALERLQQRGFIVAMKKGAFSLKVRHATEWRLTEFPCDMTHALATKEFTRWSPEIQNTVPLQTAAARRCGGARTRPQTWRGFAGLELDRLVRRHHGPARTHGRRGADRGCLTTLCDIVPVKRG